MASYSSHPSSLLFQNRLRIKLKMAISKLQFVQSKKVAITKQQRRNMAELLKQEKEQSCRIRVENIIREDVYIELLEYLELYCELLLARISLLDSYALTTNPNEALKVVIYCANHTEIKELFNLKEIFVHKFGLEFAKSALENKNDCIPDKIVTRTLNKSPSPELVSLYLKEIARAYNVPFSELSDNEQEAVQEPDSKGQNQKTLNPKLEEIQNLAPTPTSKHEKSGKKVEEDEIDVLKKRFAALKRIPK
ncbi:Ist1p [Ascoidea rubescens DSM 1968]|uniref:DUF292-domain-containing protein n=1 Tax=Ascoidea rubescens DSM 1968 TaxID=1344418 RepID=A0A1D2VN67_9ASCO|nr:DUF292-domain-containing protein [Ascoidea rubescens DSM 1968]ODV63046.1 DUF292-domain-containing protein [Ascoidea rubescens DSM 1968]